MARIDSPREFIAHSEVTPAVYVGDASWCRITVGEDERQKKGERDREREREGERGNWCMIYTITENLTTGADARAKERCERTYRALPTHILTISARAGAESQESLTARLPSTQLPVGVPNDRNANSAMVLFGSVHSIVTLVSSRACAPHWPDMTPGGEGGAGECGGPNCSVPYLQDI